jgi:hypothetical protein
MKAFLRYHSPIRGLSVVRAARATPLRHRYSTDSKEFLPDQTTPVTAELSFFDSVKSGPIPAFRILERDGSVLDGAELPEVRIPLSMLFVSDLTTQQMDKDFALKLFVCTNFGGLSISVKMPDTRL